jgi:hypothetical protein
MLTATPDDYFFTVRPVGDRPFSPIDGDQVPLRELAQRCMRRDHRHRGVALRTLTYHTPHATAISSVSLCLAQNGMTYA